MTCMINWKHAKQYESDWWQNKSYHAIQIYVPEQMSMYWWMKTEYTPMKTHRPAVNHQQTWSYKSKMIAPQPIQEFKVILIIGYKLSTLLMTLQWLWNVEQQ